jgi:hypothetical protein
MAIRLSAREWASQQWGQVELGDQRLSRRAVEIGAAMAANPETSLPNQMRSPGALAGAYRLMNNAQVTLSALLKPHCQHTVKAAQRPAVTLWVEDTTELNYTAQRGTTGLGPIGNGQGRGVLLHSTLGIEPESRSVLGLGHVQVVLRQARPTGTDRWRRTAEGRVWEVSAQAIGRPPAGAVWVHISDRGSDIFEYMATCVAADKHFLVRVAHNRCLTWGDDLPQAEQEAEQKLLDYAHTLPEYPDSGYPLDVAATAKQPARQARMALAWAQVVIAPPRQSPADIRQHPPWRVWVLRAWEPDAPPGVEALDWVLLTSLPILTLDDAHRLVDWYTCRWFCEDFHQCLKTGCRVERSQLDDADDLQRLLGFAAPLAVRLLQLRQDARQTPDAPAATLIDALMVDALARQQKINAQTMTVLDFWSRVARLGGFQGRKRDGSPGWRTIWRGWRYLSDLTEGARLFLNNDTS